MRDGRLAARGATLLHPRCPMLAPRYTPLTLRRLHGDRFLVRLGERRSMRVGRSASLGQCEIVFCTGGAANR